MLDVVAVGVPSPISTKAGWPSVATRTWNVSAPKAAVAWDEPLMVKVVLVPARDACCLSKAAISPLLGALEHGVHLPADIRAGCTGRRERDDVVFDHIAGRRRRRAEMLPGGRAGDSDGDRAAGDRGAVDGGGDGGVGGADRALRNAADLKDAAAERGADIGRLRRGADRARERVDGRFAQRMIGGKCHD